MATEELARLGGQPAAGAAQPPNRRRAMVGLLTVVTAAAFEALAVATVAPVVARALHGLALFGWAFTAFFITSVVGMVVGGEWSDRAGPVPAFLSGLGMFAAGLLVAGSASSMPVFVAGRAVQGFGAGANIVAIYVVIARVYDDAARPRVFSAISAAWVLPSIVGPAVAGFVAEHAGWRWVFYGLLPLVLAGVALLAPSLHGLGRAADAAPAPGSRRSRWRLAVLLAAGLTLVEVGGQHLGWLTLALIACGLALFVPALAGLLPAGALRLARGLPAVVALRALFSGGFFGAEAFLPLDLQVVHHLRPSLAGVPLTLGAIGWFAGSWYQGRIPAERARHHLVRGGFVLVASGVAALVSVTFATTTPWLALACWTVAGVGMGLGLATLSVLTLQMSPVAEQGVNSAGLQIADAVGTTLCIGIGGALLAAGRAAGIATGPIVRTTFLVMAALLLAGFALSGRTRPAG